MNELVIIVTKGNLANKAAKKIGVEGWTMAESFLLNFAVPIETSVNQLLRRTDSTSARL